jgi:multidrug efflux pump subunit AcrA (membrane-fusion protein)
MANALRARATYWLCAALLGAGAVAATAGTALAVNGPAADRVSAAGHLRPFTVVSPNFRDGGFLPAS